MKRLNFEGNRNLKDGYCKSIKEPVGISFLQAFFKKYFNSDQNFRFTSELNLTFVKILNLSLLKCKIICNKSKLLLYYIVNQISVIGLRGIISGTD